MGRPRVLVVGGGLTSAFLTHLLRSEAGGVSVSVWDKARRPGGRMTSHRNKTGEQIVDLGAQYITATSDHHSGGHSQVYEDLHRRGLLRPMVREINGASCVANRRELEEDVGEKEEVKAVEESGQHVAVSLDDKYWEVPSQPDEATRLSRTLNYVAPGGVETIVNYFFNKSQVEVASSRPLTHLNLHKVEDGWEAWSGGEREMFDMVVTTLPVPQLLASPPRPEGFIQGNWLDILKTDNCSEYEALLRVKYNTVFTLGLFYNKTLPITWKVKYLPKDPIIRYISNDTLRRGVTGCGSSVCVQSQVAFGEKRRDAKKEEVMAPMLSQLMSVVPVLPSPDSVISHKWRYSQTQSPYPGSPGYSLLIGSPPLIAAGDSFSHSNVDGCLISARKTCDLIKSLL